MDAFYSIFECGVRTYRKLILKNRPLSVVFTSYAAT